MDEMKKMLAEWECQTVLTGFWRCLDTNDYDGIVARMHPEGSWFRLGTLLQGRDEIMKAMQTRSATLHIHHVLTNVQFNPAQDLRQVDLSGYLTVYRYNDNKPHDWPVPLNGPWTINRCVAELRPLDGAWLIHRLDVRLTFVAPD